MVESNDDALDIESHDYGALSPADTMAVVHKTTSHKKLLDFGEILNLMSNDEAPAQSILNSGQDMFNLLPTMNMDEEGYFGRGVNPGFGY